MTVCIAILLGFTLWPSLAAEPAAGSGEADTAADDLDLDLDGLDDLEDEFSDDNNGPASGGPPGMDPGMEQPVDDFDLTMPEEDRKKRMLACYVHMMNRLHHRKDQMEQIAKEVIEQRPQMSREQALNTVAVSWMMACYHNVDADGMKQAIPGKAPAPELEQRLFAPPARMQQGSERQWRLLEEVAQEAQQQAARDAPFQQQQQQKQQQQQQYSTPPRSDAGPLPTASFGRQSQVIYVLVVFGTIFGLGAAFVMRLSKKETGKGTKDKASKAEKKAHQVEQKLSRRKK
jgi:hypothetical protein